MDDVRATLRQQLVTDRLLGVRSVPIVRTKSPVLAKSGTAASATSSFADVSDKVERLRLLDEQQVKGCTKCPLSKTRTRTVFGQGHADAKLVFVGEAPGYEEDQQGLAFVGRAGQLLTRMIAAMGLSRDDVFICNVLKCRPPQNRDPAAEEILACGPYLRQQLSIIEPDFIVALGAPAAKTLLETTLPIGKLRGRFHSYRLTDDEDDPGVPLMPTYHPAYLLRNPADKRKAWEDLQQVMGRMGLASKGAAIPAD